MADTNDRRQRLKNTAHINVAFKESQCDAKLLGEVLYWLNGQSVSPASEDEIRAHLHQLQRRHQGLDGMKEMAEKAGKELGFFVVPRVFMPSYTFAEFDLGVSPHLILSVDLLNAGGELGLPEEMGDVLEFFVVGAKLPEEPEVLAERGKRWQRERERLRQLVKDLARDFNVRSAFGGYTSFMGRYVAWHQRSRSKKNPRRAHPWEFLWPLTYLPECSLDEAGLTALPVHHAERVDGGALVQVFEDLHMGYQDKYVQAAHALGLRAVWELRP